MTALEPADNRTTISVEFGDTCQLDALESGDVASLHAPVKKPAQTEDSSAARPACQVTSRRIKSSSGSTPRFRYSIRPFAESSKREEKFIMTRDLVCACIRHATRRLCILQCTDDSESLPQEAGEAPPPDLEMSFNQVPCGLARASPQQAKS